jgi:hypothetical protein
LKKISSTHIEFSKFKFYLLLQSVVVIPILCYQLCWHFGETTMANCYVKGIKRFDYDNTKNSGTLFYNYQVNGITYEDYATRNEIPLTQKQIEIKYLTFSPSTSRLNTFEGNWLGFLIAYGLFFTISSIIFLIPNDTMPKNSYLYFTKQKPFIHMIVK